MMPHRCIMTYHEAFGASEPALPLFQRTGSDMIVYVPCEMPACRVERILHAVRALGQLDYLGMYVVYIVGAPASALYFL